METPRKRSSLRLSPAVPPQWVAICGMLACALALLLASCAGGEDEPVQAPTPVAPVDGVLAVRGFDFGFELAAIIVQRDEAFRIKFTNDSRSVLHNLKIDDLEADSVESESSGSLNADEGELFVGAEPGGEGSLSFVPREAGTFAFYCTIRGHRALGMEGAFIVQ